MAQHVPAVLTQYTAEEVLSALLTLWGEVFEVLPEKKSLLVLLAHSRLETGVWKKMYCNNPGNIKAIPTGDHDYCYFTCTEVLTPAQANKYLVGSGRREDLPEMANVDITNRRTVVQKDGSTKELWTVRFWPTHPVCCFRAFPTLVDGMRDHFLFLTSARFIKAWACVLRGDPAGFVDELKAQGYMTADLAPYRASVVSIFNEYTNSLKDWEPVFDKEADKPVTIVPQFSLQNLTWSIIDEDLDRHGNESDTQEES